MRHRRAALAATAIAALLGAAPATAANIALGKPVTASSFYSAGSETFAAASVTDGAKGNTGSPHNWSFWLTAQGQNTGWVVVDLQGVYALDRLRAQNTHNRNWFDRGARGLPSRSPPTATPTPPPSPPPFPKTSGGT